MVPHIVVTYTPRYSGCHRICFRTTEVEFCCYQDNSPSVLNTPKTVEISLGDFEECLVNIPTDLPTCDLALSVNGYVQPCCSDINTNENRVFFITTFPETEECSTYIVECPDSVDCGKFTIPNCIGVDDGTEYELSSDLGSVNIISVCSGGEGPEGDDYIIQQTNTLPVQNEGCINSNGEFDTCLSGWTATIVSDHTWKCQTAPAPMSSDAAGYTGPAIDPLFPQCQGILAQSVPIIPGNTYSLTFDVLIEDTPCTNGSYIDVTLGGTTFRYDFPGYYPGEAISVTAVDDSFSFTGYQDCKNDIDSRNMYIDNVCLTLTGVKISCCECKLYNIIVRNPIDVYYTDCNQTVDVISVESGAIGVTVCAIPGSVWPVNKIDNAEILAITEVGDCIPTD